jgi:gliding motility-associated-like protein
MLTLQAILRGFFRSCFHRGISIYIKNKHNILAVLKKRILYIILGVMLLSLKGMGQITIQPGPYNFIYNGSDQFPTRSASCSGLNFNFSTRFLDASNNPLPGLTRPRGAGSYTMIVELSGDCVEQQSVSFTINKATPTITITSGTYTYSGSSQGPGVTETNTGGSTSVPTFSYVGTNGTIYGPLQAKPTNAGSYLVTASVVTDANYFSASSVATSFTINKKPLTITVNALDKVYNGNNSAPSPTLTSDQIFSDDVYFNFTSSTFDDKNIGSNKTFTVSGISISSGTDAGNYSLTSSIAIGTASITARSITISAITSDKEYDGTVSSTGVPDIIAGSLALNDDEVFIQTYNTKNKGNNKILTPSVVSILDASSNSMIGNYSITYESISNGVITAKQLTIADPEITKIKEYDKTATANVIAGTLSNVVKVGSVEDVVTASAVGTYSTSSVGTAKTITVVYTIAGADKDNYIKPVDKVYTDGVITAKQLTIADPIITMSKVYDKTVTVNVIAGTLSNVVKVGSVEDVVTASAVGTYSTSSVGTAKTITVVYTIAGADKDNYIKPVDKVYTDGVITAKQLTIADPIITMSKVYDKTVTVNVTAGTLSNVVKVGSVEDVVTASAVGTYSTSSVGTAKTITVVYTLAGADKDNYIKPVDKVYTDGVITAKQLTITDPTITKSKEYDKTATANVIAGTLSNVVKVGSVEDVVTASAVGTYTTSTVGTAKTITVVYTLAGADKDNYIKPVDKVYTDGVITAKQLTITDPTITKIKEYDKTATANVIAGTLSNVVKVGSVEDVVTASALGTYTTSTVGTAKTITVVYTLAGADKDNYIKPVDKVYTDGVITAKQLTITDPTITKSKEYDKTATANVIAGTLSNVVKVGSVEDVVTASAVGTYTTSTVGTAKTITVVYTLAGADKDNYIKPVDKVYTDGVITAKQLTITDPTITKSKEYDKTATANVIAGTLSNVVKVGSVEDVVTASAVGTYTTSSVGTAKTITVVYTLAGADKDNYIKPVDKVYTDGVITAKQLTIADPTITKSKEYDKTATANVIAGTLSNVVKVGSVEDAVTASAVGTYSTSSAGTAKTITVVYTLDGADKDNYIKPVDKVYTDGVITARALTVTGVTTSNKQYDRTNTASVSGGTLVGVISPDLVNLTQSGTFAQVNVGTGIAITSTSSIDNTNYRLTQPTLIARDITAKPLIVTATPGQTKVFGAVDPPNFTYTLSAPLLGSDVLNGALKRDAGEATGSYAINQGTLINLNYDITFVGNNFVITPAPVNNTGNTKPFAVPNAFSPNGDGKNDKFKIIFNNTTGVTLSLQIFNRNGTLMFYTNNISEGWDGRYKDVMQDMGIYFVKYRIEIAGGMTYEDTPRLYLFK